MKTTLCRSLILIGLWIAPAVISAQYQDLKIPDDFKPFVGKGMTAVALESADLNGDGRKDHILVVENPGQKTKDDLEGPRTLLILTTEAGGKLKLAKQNDKVVYCRTCGGVFGDPLAGIDVSRNSFTVNNYGGSNWRWGDSYKFNYSRIDQTWQLVQVVKETFSAINPNNAKSKTLTPKNFGKVDIADFDPDKFH